MDILSQNFLMPRAWGWMVAVLVLCSCASSPYSTEALDPPENVQVSGAAPLYSQAYGTLEKQLTSLGYQGVGMEFESDSVLEKILEVFEDPKTHQKSIVNVYTGYALSYDEQFKSLTFPVDLDKEAIISFIEQKVPQQAAAPNSPEPGQKDS